MDRLRQLLPLFQTEYTGHGLLGHNSASLSLFAGNISRSGNPLKCRHHHQKKQQGKYNNLFFHERNLKIISKLSTRTFYHTRVGKQSLYPYFFKFKIAALCSLL